MNNTMVGLMHKQAFQEDTKARDIGRMVKHILLKIAKTLTFDADAMCKSKDWPYLWR